MKTCTDTQADGLQRYQATEKSSHGRKSDRMKPVDKGGLGIAEVLDYMGIPYDVQEDQQTQMEFEEE